MRNYWLNNAKKKQMFKELDEIISDVYANDGSFSDIVAQLNDDQMDFLMNMLIKEFVSDSSDGTFAIEFSVP